MINFHFFDQITLDWLMVPPWNLVCARFINFWKKQNIFYFIVFWLP